jgi:hypothetical protein
MRIGQDRRGAMQEYEATPKITETPPNSTVYVHLLTGEVKEITDVEDMAMTDAQLIFFRGDHEAVILQRHDVYFSCCQPDAEPSAY